MSDDLHRSVWTVYRQAGGGDLRANASSAFQMAVDVVLHHRPGVDASSACSEAARLILKAPRWARRPLCEGGPVESLQNPATEERSRLNCDGEPW